MVDWKNRGAFRRPGLGIGMMECPSGWNMEGWKNMLKYRSEEQERWNAVPIWTMEKQLN